MITISSAGYDQVLRRSGDTLQFRSTKEAYLNDNSDIDSTGTQDMGVTISNYLAELASKGVTRVYCDAGSIYSTSTTIDIPAYMTLEGPGHIMQGASANTVAEFRARTSNMTIFRMQGNYSVLRGLKIDLSRSRGMVNNNRCKA